MLVLSRKISQQIRIGSDIRVTVVKIDRNQVRLGITAPAGVVVLREELGKRPMEPDANFSLDRPSAPALRAASNSLLCSLAG